jgi:hypothetical protein
MKRITNNLKIGNSFYAIDEILNENYILLDDIALLINRSIRNIKSFCAKADIAVLVIKENGKTKYELVDNELLTAKLVEQSKIEYKKMPKKLLKSISPTLFWHRKKRANDFLASKFNFTEYTEMFSLLEPSYLYRLLGLFLSCSFISQVNLLKTKENKYFNITSLKNSAIILNNTPEKTKDLEKAIKNAMNSRNIKDIDTFISFVYENMKLDAGETFLTQSECLDQFKEFKMLFKMDANATK